MPPYFLVRQSLDTTVDREVVLKLPQAHRFRVHVVNSAGDPVAGAEIGSGYTSTFTALVDGVATSGQQAFRVEYPAAPPTTDQNGDAYIWAFPGTIRGLSVSSTVGGASTTTYVPTFEFTGAGNQTVGVATN